MALLDKFRQLADAREALAQLGEDPFRATIGVEKARVKMAELDRVEAIDFGKQSRSD